MNEQAQIAVFALIDAALAWHDVEFGAPGEALAAMELSAVLNSYRADLERLRAGVTLTEDDYLALHRPAGGYTKAREQRAREMYRRTILGAA